MTQDYTPTTDEVRRGFRADPSKYEYAETPEYIDENWWELNKLAFDRWIAAHDAQIRAEAWDEGHRTAIDDLNNPDCFSGTPNPYMEVQQ
jgi:hypothetical protein